MVKTALRRRLVLGASAWLTLAGAASAIAETGLDPVRR